MHLGAAGLVQHSWGGRPGRVDLGTDLPWPDDPRALLMHVGPFIDLLERFYSLRMP
jgi:hypothetical protein